MAEHTETGKNMAQRAEDTRHDISLHTHQQPVGITAEGWRKIQFLNLWQP